MHQAVLRGAWARFVLLCTFALASEAFGQQLVCGSPDSLDYQPRLDAFLGKSVSEAFKLRAVFVDFADNPDLQYTDAMAEDLWTEFTGFIDRQSRGTLELDIAIVRDPAAPEEVWTAFEMTNRYASGQTYGEYPRYSSYWSPNFYFRGELQAEILLKIQTAYAGLSSPFDGADMIVFLYLPAPGDTNPLGAPVGGVGNLNVRQSMFPILAGARTYPIHPAVPYGIVNNWWGGGHDLSWSIGTIVAHEFGHAIGLDHPAYSHSIPVCNDTETVDSYYFGSYNLMRPIILGGYTFQPYHERDLVKLGWLERVDVTSNARGVLMEDIRSGGKVYYIDNLDPSLTSVHGVSTPTKESFSIALHAGVGDDARQVPAGGSMYKSRGLAIWHSLEQLEWNGQEYDALADLESAYGLFEDPVNRLGADPVMGSDNMDVWFDRSLACASRSPGEAATYPGGASDFFSGTGSEFSYRTNPSSACHDNEMAIPPVVWNHWPFLPQDVVNSIIIRVREDYGDSMRVDILLAPYEDVASPNGGEMLQVGQPYDITWSKEFTTDQPNGIVNTVDIYCSRGAGYGDQLIASGVDATLGTYAWAPDATQVGTTCKIKIVCHNVNDAAHVGEDESDAVFTLVDLPLAKFTDVSSQTGLSPQGSPYSAAPGDFQMDEKSDLLITSTGAWVNMGRAMSVQPSGAPLFGNVTASNVMNARGVAVADFDNDGDQDFFLAHETTPKLYRNQNGTFFDVTASMGLSSLAAPSTAACWGDYDRDGWLDLYVVRSTKDPGVPEPPDLWTISGESHRLFRNLGVTGGGFVDVSVAAGISGLAGNGSVSASWGDIENDGDLDLIVTNLQDPPTGPPGGIGSHLFVNQGDGTFTEEFEDRFPDRIYYCTAAQWADMNNDGFLDLVVSCALPGSAIYLNGGAGHFPAASRVWFPNPASASGNGYNGVQVFDHDLDGWKDVLWISRNTNEPSHFFSGVPTATGVAFVNNTANAGLSGSSKALGAVAADYTHDGDLDLFVGRPASSGQYFYKTDSQSGSNSLGRNYVKVCLDSPLKANNRQGIGATVTVTAGDLVQMQAVDGGSGRGGQRDRDLIFGLGDYSGVVTASVTWPRGYHQNDVSLVVSSAAEDTINTITDETMAISNLNVATIIVPGTTTYDWVFSWDTNVACNTNQDLLTFDQAGIANPCWPGWTVLTPSTPGVTYVYEAKPGGGYLHKFIMYGQECNLNCSFRYTASSAMGTNQATSATKSKKVTFCPSGF